MGKNMNTVLNKSLTLGEVLMSNGYLDIPGNSVDIMELLNNPTVVTVANNFSYYGFCPSQDCIKQLLGLNSEQLIAFWQRTETQLKELTFDNRKMDDFVVYKNFPSEVMNMSDAQYWGRQILMYFGFPNELFTQTANDRPDLKEKRNLKVLHLAKIDTVSKIFNTLISSKVKWTPTQVEHFKFLLNFIGSSPNLSDFGFKENGIQCLSSLMDKGKKISINDTTDVLRLAAFRSDSDVGLNDVTFKSFKRSERRTLCNLIEDCKNIEEDFAMRPSLWKALLSKLHPGEFKLTRVVVAYDKLYNNTLVTFNSKVEKAISNKDKKALELLISRPGEFMRRFHKLHDTFGNIDSALVEIFQKLNTYQLLKFKKYITTINARKNLMYAPKGNWSKAQIVKNTKSKFTRDQIMFMCLAITDILEQKLGVLIPDGVSITNELDKVKFQSNDQEIGYGRGTVFNIPSNMRFIRSASYWQQKSRGNTWFDNGWNFFDSNWKSVGSCCWNVNKHEDGAVFSGDPTNSKDLKGRACQMIDLYPEKLRNSGVRYAVWNILAYSKITFSDADEVIGSLQWGENPEKGKLYEPSRAQLVFPLKGESLTKYVAVIDLQDMTVTYLDANLRGRTGSANSNGEILEEIMPAYMEYLNTIPSIYDLLSCSKMGSMPILYSDKHVTLNNQTAYVFRPENKSNTFTQLDLNRLLES